MSRRNASKDYANDVRTQIREKEQVRCAFNTTHLFNWQHLNKGRSLTQNTCVQVRIAERNSWFEEGIKLDEEARARRIKLDDAKKKKLDQLRYVHFILTTSLHTCMSIPVVRSF